MATRTAAAREAEYGADVIDIAVVARRIGRSESTIRRWIKQGKFPGYCFGDSYVIPAEWYGAWKRGEWTPRKDERAAVA